MDSAHAIHIITDAVGKEACRALIVYLDEHKSDKLEAMRNEIGSGLSLVRKEIAEVYADLKTDMAELRTGVKTEIAELRTEVKTEINELRTEVKTEINELRTEVKTEVAGLRTEIYKSARDQIKWFFASNAALAALVVGALKLL